MSIRSARAAVTPCGATSSTLRWTTSQPRSLLSIAKSKRARSRVRPSASSLDRIDQTCLARKRRLCPDEFALIPGFALTGAVYSLAHDHPP
jgi:hypothetical protein